MTLGQPDNIIRAFNKDSVEKSKKYLQSKYSITEYTREDEDVASIFKNSNLNVTYQKGYFWKINIDCSFGKVTLVIIIPAIFPDKLPKLYLSRKDFKSIYPIPHVDSGGFLCTRDPDTIVINDDKPGEALEELIKIGVTILEEGKNKTNEQDFIDEFLAYWDEEATFKSLSLFEPSENATHITFFELSKKILETRYIIANSEEEVIRWLKIVSPDCTIIRPIKALYLPLSKFIPTNFKTNEDLLALSSKFSNKNEAQELQSYLTQSYDFHVVISSFVEKSERIMFGWRPVGLKNVSVKGFRKGKEPLDMLLKYTKKNQIKRFRIIRVDKNRILKRGGTINSLIDKDVSLSLIGCGSLGSYLAMSLARCGVSHFDLVDNECLEVENIARHLCGFSSVNDGLRKVDAVKKRITEHFPYIVCNTYFGDVLQLLRDKSLKFDRNDVIVIALGSMGVERRLNFIAQKGDIKSPIIYLWMEPFGVAGHVLYIPPHTKGCYDCCIDSDDSFKYSVAAPKQNFKKRETGCQNTYIPYSSLDIEKFVSFASKWIIGVLESKINKSMLYTLVGDMDLFVKNGYSIRDRYIADVPNKSIEIEIIPNENCKTCG